MIEERLRLVPNLVSLFPVWHLVYAPFFIFFLFLFFLTRREGS